MGEQADMMLDGTLCQTCGVYIEHGQADGFPRPCSKACKWETPKPVKVKTDTQREARRRRNRRRRARKKLEEEGKPDEE